jgi:hypothetical protein
MSLTMLTQKDQPFKWTCQQQEAFEALIKACTSNPLLRIFNLKKPIQIETDTSDLVIGMCLSQEYDSKWHPIAYYLRKLLPAERNYDIHDKELLAIVTAL